ncbi:MAG: hypothetical protein OXH84_06880 [Gammaproteobacteria bacterium]|nr:hypothetical protein [Gammaproteobacteria bacterium]
MNLELNFHWKPGAPFACGYRYRYHLWNARPNLLRMGNSFTPQASPTEPGDNQPGQFGQFTHVPSLWLYTANFAG